MRHIQAFDTSVCLLVASDSPLLRYIVDLLHIICIHLAVKLFIVHGQQIVQADHVGETINLLLLLLLGSLSSCCCLIIKWNVFHGKLARGWIIISIVH